MTRYEREMKEMNRVNYIDAFLKQQDDIRRIQQEELKWKLREQTLADIATFKQRRQQDEDYRKRIGEVEILTEKAQLECRQENKTH